MWELMGNAWRGWLEFTSNGKLCALFLASLVFLWVYYKRAEQKNVLIYGAMMTGFCIVPATAAVLMVYQTKFFHHRTKLLHYRSVVKLILDLLVFSY